MIKKIKAWLHEKTAPPNLPTRASLVSEVKALKQEQRRLKDLVNALMNERAAELRKNKLIR